MPGRDSGHHRRGCTLFHTLVWCSGGTMCVARGHQERSTPAVPSGRGAGPAPCGWGGVGWHGMGCPRLTRCAETRRLLICAHRDSAMFISVRCGAGCCWGVRHLCPVEWLLQVSPPPMWVEPARPLSICPAPGCTFLRPLCFEASPAPPSCNCGAGSHECEFGGAGRGPAAALTALLCKLTSMAAPAPPPPLQIPSNFTASVLGQGATEEKGENARLVRSSCNRSDQRAVGARGTRLGAGTRPLPASN